MERKPTVSQSGLQATRLFLVLSSRGFNPVLESQSGQTEVHFHCSGILPLGRNASPILFGKFTFLDERIYAGIGPDSVKAQIETLVVRGEKESVRVRYFTSLAAVLRFLRIPANEFQAAIPGLPA